MHRPTKDPHSRPAIHTLERLHSELGGQILENKAEAKRLAESMKHVEAVLKLLQPGYDVRPIAVKRRKPNPWFKRGTVYRAAVDVLRVAEKPLTTSEIIDRMLAAKGVTNPDRKAARDLIGAVNSSLKNHEGKSVAAVDATMPARWQLIRSAFSS